MTVLPLIHGSTSPLKNRCPACSPALVPDHRHRPAHPVSPRIDSERVQPLECRERGRPWLALLVGCGAASLVVVTRAAAQSRGPQVYRLAAGLGLLVCPFTFASVTILIYMLRPDVRATFEAPGGAAAPGAGEAEPTFALSLFGMLALGLVLTAGAVLLY